MKSPTDSQHSVRLAATDSLMVNDRKADGGLAPTIALAVVAVVVAYLPISSVSVSLSTIRAATHASSTDLQWVSDAYVLPMAAAILSAGTLGDIYGRRRVYVFGEVFLALGALVAGLAAAVDSGSALKVLWAGQAIMGLGAGMLMPTTLALIAHAVPDHHARSRYTAMWASGLVGGLAAGPIISGVLLEHFSWGWIFAPVGILAIATLPVAHMRLPESKAVERRRLDWTGQALGTTVIVGVIFGVIEGGEKGWSSVSTVVGLAVAAAGLVAFVLAELRSRSPILDPRLFRSAPFATSGIAALVMMSVLSGAMFLLGVYFGVGEHLSPLSIGWRLLVLMGITVLFNPLGGRAMRRWHPILVLAFGLALGAIGCAMITTLGARAGFLDVAWRLAIVGIADAFMLSTVSVVAIGSVPHRLAGVAATGNTALRQLGAALGPAVFGVIYADRQSGGGSQTSALHFAFGVAAIGLGVTAVGCLLVARRPSGAAHASSP